MKTQLPKAYLRIDPNLDQHPEFEGMLILICAANRQPRRGCFATRSILDRLLGKRRADRFLKPRAAGKTPDVVQLADGTYFLDGWDLWQEGDITVGERVGRIRAKRAGADYEQEEDQRRRVAAAYRTANWRLRAKVFERDNHTCRYCGTADYPSELLVAEHVIPLPRGTTTLDNLVTACRPCNKKKGGRTPEEAGMALRPLAICDGGDASPVTNVTRHPSEALDVKAGDGANAPASPPPPPAHAGGAAAKASPAPVTDEKLAAAQAARARRYVIQLGGEVPNKLERRWKHALKGGRPMAVLLRRVAEDVLDTRRREGSFDDWSMAWPPPVEDPPPEAPPPGSIYTPPTAEEREDGDRRLLEARAALDRGRAPPGTGES